MLGTLRKLPCRTPGYSTHDLATARISAQAAHLHVGLDAPHHIRTVDPNERP